MGKQVKEGKTEEEGSFSLCFVVGHRESRVGSGSLGTGSSYSVRSTEAPNRVGDELVKIRTGEARD